MDAPRPIDFPDSPSRSCPPHSPPPLYESPCRCCLKPDSLTLLYGCLFVSAATPEGKILQVSGVKTTKNDTFLKGKKKSVSKRATKKKKKK